MAPRPVKGKGFFSFLRRWLKKSEENVILSDVETWYGNETIVVLKWIYFINKKQVNSIIHVYIVAGGRAYTKLQHTNPTHELLIHVFFLKIQNIFVIQFFLHKLYLVSLQLVKCPIVQLKNRGQTIK